MKALQTYHDMGFIITEKVVSNYTSMFFHLLSGNPVKSFHDMMFSGVGEDQLLQDITMSIDVDGFELNPHRIDLEFNEEEIGPSLEIHIDDENGAVQCTYLKPINFTLNSESITLYCERGVSSSLNKKSISFTIRAAGWVEVVLDDEQLIEEFQPGMASSIIDELAGRYNITLDYQAVDWYITAHTLYANDDTALDVIKKIAEAIGAMVQDVDNVLTIKPRHEISVWNWRTATPDIILTENADYIMQTTTIDERRGYNKYIISDQLTPEEQYFLRQEPIDDFTKEIRTFMVPWYPTYEDTEPVITHTGGSWVRLEKFGVTELLIENEEVEIFAGEGNTSSPVYSISNVEYKQTNLGGITFGEDGTIITDVEGESIVWITYTTRYLLYHGHDERAENVQFVLEGEII
ncbi:hypothetical protein KAR91_27125 [Candidatus Pacearchaeota archaeon]|nr:hypothetical protein [Candidatus Pacearchaeota archaeon]